MVQFNSLCSASDGSSITSSKNYGTWETQAVSHYQNVQALWKGSQINDNALESRPNKHVQVLTININI